VSTGLKLSQRLHTKTHKEWLEMKSVDVEKHLSNLFSSDRALREKKTSKVDEAFQGYYNQGEPRKSDHRPDLNQIFQI
jgi:hypothetical protein